MKDCCSKGKDSLRDSVRESYAKIAMSGDLCCCGTSKREDLDHSEFAGMVGYSKDDLKSLPEGANMGLSCGNPTAVASLRQGEVVVDLGCGGGFDVFIAAEKVGERGRAIGVDMTPEMVSKARKNAVMFTERTGLCNVEFRLGEIEHLPLADNSADVVISNCVINLSPDKQQVWREIARVLKPGGRVAVSDLALLKPLPAGIMKSLEALVGCVAGAVLVSDTEKMAKKAGLKKIRTDSKPDYIEKMTEWNDPLYKTVVRNLPKGKKIGDYVASMYFNAVK